MRRKLNRVRMILKCVCKDSKNKVVITFFSCFVSDFSYWLCRWLYKVVMQFYKSGYAKVGFKGGTIQGGEDTTFLAICVFCVAIDPP